MSRVLCRSVVTAEHRYMLFCRLVNNNQTDQGDETESLEMAGLVWEGVKEPYFV
jgi:hypothetical protein